MWIFTTTAALATLLSMFLSPPKNSDDAQQGTPESNLLHQDSGPKQQHFQNETDRGMSKNQNNSKEQHISDVAPN